MSIEKIYSFMEKVEGGPEKVTALKGIIHNLNEESKIKREANEALDTKITGIESALTNVVNAISSIGEVTGKKLEVNTDNTADLAELSTKVNEIVDYFGEMKAKTAETEGELLKTEFQKTLESEMKDVVHDDFKKTLVENLTFKNFSNFSKTSEGKFVDKDGKGIGDMLISHLESNEQFKPNNTVPGPGVKVPASNTGDGNGEKTKPQEQVQAKMKELGMA